jgi:hypothetical protein
VHIQQSQTALLDRQALHLGHIEADTVVLDDQANFMSLLV